jgi:hypothetical protein
MAVKSYACMYAYCLLVMINLVLVCISFRVTLLECDKTDLSKKETLQCQSSPRQTEAKRIATHCPKFVTSMPEIANGGSE